MFNFETPACCVTVKLVTAAGKQPAPMYHSCTWPAASCCAATAVMWRRAHRRYTGWSRPQSAACAPLLFTPCRAAAELIWLNSFGRAVSTYIFDAITRYEA